MQAATALRGRRADGGQAAGRRRLPGHLLVVPTAVWTLAFFLIPLVLITVFSFGTENLVTFNVDFGWTASNYAAFGSALYVGTLLRSLQLSVGTTAGGALLACAIVPCWTSCLVRTYSWVNLLQTNGPIDRLAFGITGHHLQILYSPAS